MRLRSGEQARHHHHHRARELVALCRVRQLRAAKVDPTKNTGRRDVKLAFHLVCSTSLGVASMLAAATTAAATSTLVEIQTLQCRINTDKCPARTHTHTRPPVQAKQLTSASRSNRRIVFQEARGEFDGGGDGESGRSDRSGRFAGGNDDDYDDDSRSSLTLCARVNRAKWPSNPTTTKTQTEPETEPETSTPK